MKQEYKEQLCRKIAANYSELEERIMQDIVRRIKKTGEITSTADWQINRLLILGNSSENIEKMLKKALDASYPEMFEMYDKVIDWEYVRNKDIYEQINAEFISFDENVELKQATEALIRQSGAELENITQSLGFYIDYGNGKPVMTPLSQVYGKFLDDACFDIVYGAFDYNSVLRRAVTQLTNSGLRQIDYATGHHNRVDVAARRAVMTGVSQLTGKISDMNAEKLGTEYFEVAWHAGARPTHAEWQGRVWSKGQLVTVCGLGSVTGLLGANCYHEYYPFIPEISERNWTDEWLEAKNVEENTPKEFKGKNYTLYEAKQKQRQMETAMRAQRQKVQLLKAGGADPDDVMLARCKYQGQLDEYARFSKKMGLKQERERIYLDMRGRVAPGRLQKPSSDEVDVKGFFKNIFFNKDKVVSEFEKSIKKKDEGDVKQLLKGSMDRIMFEKSQRKRSYFDAKTKTIYLADSVTPSTIAHELFHEIDATYGITQNGALSKSLQRDYGRLQKLSEKSGKSIEDMLYSKYPEVFMESRRGKRLKEEYRGISDILNGMSSGEIRLGYRHEDRYWKKSRKLEKETWAQYGRMLYQEDEKVMEFAEILFPDTTAEVKLIVKEMIK